MLLHADVARAKVDPLWHYLTLGRREGRAFTADRSGTIPGVSVGTTGDARDGASGESWIRGKDETGANVLRSRIQKNARMQIERFTKRNALFASIIDR